MYSFVAIIIFFAGIGTMNSHKENMMVSVIVLVSSVGDMLLIKKLNHYMELHFNFYEIIIISNPSDNVDEDKILGKNIRVIVLNDNANDDILRKKAIEQAIGDFVVLYDPQEADFCCIERLVESNIGGYEFTGLSYSKNDNSLYGILTKIFFFTVSKLSGYGLDENMSYTGCFGRTLVNVINEKKADQSYLKLMLASIGFKNTTIEGAERKKRSMAYVLNRFGGCLDIIGSVPHRLLLLTAWLSLAACTGSVAYILYVVGVWFWASHVQPGWTTTALVQGALFGILFFSIFVFSCIFSAQFRKKGQDRFAVARDVSQSDFMSSFTDLNITDKQ